MNSQKHIQDELGSLESNLSFNNNQIYSVPEGYFEGLAASVLAKVKGSDASVQAELGELSPLLAGIPKVTPYSVPFFYFEQNTQLIPDFSKEPQLSVLNGIDKMPYQLPHDYFENLAEEILIKVSQPRAKIVPLFASKWMRMAAAAVIGGALFLAGYQYFNSDAQPFVATTGPDTTQPSVSISTPAIEQEIKKMSTKDLEQFIQNDPVATKDIAVKTNADKNNVKALLKDVSDAEMEAFLSGIPTSDDELFLTD